MTDSTDPTSSTASNRQSSTDQLAFWITLSRGLLAIALGISLLFIPDKTLPMLANLVAMFCITTGLVSLRNDPAIPNRKLARMTAIVLVITGVLIYMRNVANLWVTWESIVHLLGAVLTLTGILHIFYGIQIGKQRSRGRTRLSVVMGVFEMGLGVLFLFSQTGRDPIIYLITTIWALIGGSVIIADAIAQRMKAKRRQAESTPIASKKR